jgi:predicted kinase
VNRLSFWIPFKISTSVSHLFEKSYNCFRWLRDRFRNFGARYGYQTTLIFLDIPLAEIEQRIAANEQNQTRNKVKQEIIEKMQKTFESPQVDEKSIKYAGEKSIEQWIMHHFNS